MIELAWTMVKSHPTPYLPQAILTEHLRCTPPSGDLLEEECGVHVVGGFEGAVGRDLIPGMEDGRE